MLLAMTALLAALLGYAALCLARPFGPCRRCKGTGETTRFSKPRTCPRCHGRKVRLRVGRRAHNAWRRTHEAGIR
ncbi:hypothetical protein ACLVWQ_17605 (plasmid) [Streptomyces sp. CWNU-52B]|uniref:hypothetical protein n=1 Tax=unclassified Streptomyces TaxID=2593676 RepID=UPI0039C204E2